MKHLALARLEVKMTKVHRQAADQIQNWKERQHGCDDWMPYMSAKILLRCYRGRAAEAVYKEQDEIERKNHQAGLIV